MPGNISESGDTSVRQTGKNHCLHGAYILVGKTDKIKIKKVNHKIYYIVITISKKNKAKNEDRNCKWAGVTILNRVFRYGLPRI